MPCVLRLTRVVAAAAVARAGLVTTAAIRVLEGPTRVMKGGQVVR